MSEKLYKVHEIFPSIQGEGLLVGTPMWFIRFAGCNLHCSFCDTDHTYKRSMTVRNIVDDIFKTTTSSHPRRWVCLTGGEPLLQVDPPLLTELLCFFRGGIAIETNGTIPRVGLLDDIPLDYHPRIHITLSPKKEKEAIFDVQTEVKLIVEDKDDWKDWLSWRMGETDVNEVQHKFLQPCTYTGDPIKSKRSLDRALEILNDFAYRGWRLSVQVHKLIGVQ